MMCPYCSSTFKLNIETGQKEPFGNHYIVPNTMDAAAVKELTIDWLKRLHHKPNMVNKEFYVTDIKGFSLPLWIISLEGHTAWKGMIQKHKRAHNKDEPLGSDFIVEEGQFRRSYRWAVSARNNILESWGLTRLHEPMEAIQVEWDGFPLDSTFSRGRLDDPEEDEKSAYDMRKFFEFKLANGVPILGVEVPEEEALRRGKDHINLYHYKIAKLNCDYLIDQRTELEIAGIQLIHMPFWNATYVYRPRSTLRHFYKPKQSHVIVDGYSKGLLSGQLAITHKDKVTINGIVAIGAALFFLLLGASWHPAYYLVSLFALMVASASAWLSLSKMTKKKDEQLSKKHNSFGPAIQEQPGEAV